ncbi:oligopeptide transporter, OPT family [Haemophilus haemolyticus]|jgi:oligopeptide transporter, OPT family|uniref:OPT family oligopeptide transporter n=1 Tax=Haemophilus haemolyticus TaxID=726 RepID=UPI00021B3BD1|nr:oligopeptide transporter, OPT family [Haemophilus haemolyticus]EGT74938.1 Putative oligopeptide transporter [Haemophilus haemolyticus M21127]KKZ53353.1 oligopeptide transporter [Haemophilus haemolyticus]MDQ6574485.1 oligopeptide transporter, OPT family [Haemophilus haemolyticus]RDE67980.1 oligopeptide transporter, OPT family [Haemophilus haemolyticus]TPH04582.1 oligopeptide transporter, OPT family [Haemophilus haemolyticus]
MHNENLKELTFRGIILGALITVIFTASNVYLGLKVGMTFASSIPAAVISMAVLKFFKDSSILENNMVQTQASSAGTLSSVIFVLPGLLMMGYWQDFPFWQTMLICAAGGTLGVLFTIPLRRAMVVNSDLPYPEGVAAAEILKAGNHADGDSGVKDIAYGGVLAGLVAFLTNGLRVMADGASAWIQTGKAAFQLPMGFSLALLGAGYLIGIVGGIAMLIGVILTWGVAVPYFTMSGDIAADASLIDAAMVVWKTKVRFIGVGTIGIAAIWTLLILMKPMIEGMLHSFRMLKGGQAESEHRVDIDLSPKTMIYILIATVVLIVISLHHFIAAAPISPELSILLVVVCTFLAVFIGFFVAAASGYMAGLVGSSSSPISGIGIISVIVISLVLVSIGNASGLFETVDGQKFLTALTLFTASIVLTTATISNDNLQDLKTGLLVDATPWRQQVALIIGCFVGALVIAPVLEILYHAYGFSGALPRPDMDPSQALSAPQATLMTTISQGIFTNKLEWTYILTGVVLGAVLITIDAFLKKVSNKVFGLPVIAVGIGIYLPPSINMPVIVGAFLAWIMTRHIAKLGNKEVSAKAERFGTLFSAGLIVGESLMGVILAFIIAASVTTGGSEAPLSLNLENWDTIGEWLGLIVFIVGIVIFASRVLRAKKSD